MQPLHCHPGARSGEPGPITIVGYQWSAPGSASACTVGDHGIPGSAARPRDDREACRFVLQKPYPGGVGFRLVVNAASGSQADCSRCCAAASEDEIDLLQTGDAD